METAIRIDYWKRLVRVYKDMGWSETWPTSIQRVTDGVIYFEEYGRRFEDRELREALLYPDCGYIVDERDCAHRLHCKLDGKCPQGNMGIFDAFDIDICAACAHVIE